jgi:hypothetical protein
VGVLHYVLGETSNIEYQVTAVTTAEAARDAAPSSPPAFDLFLIDQRQDVERVAGIQLMTELQRPIPLAPPSSRPVSKRMTVNPFCFLLFRRFDPIM